MKGKLEDVELPAKQVDIIISEVSEYTHFNPREADMGSSGWAISCYTNLCWIPSFSLETNTWSARHPSSRYKADDEQAPNGLMFPDKATLFLAAIEDEDYKEEKINCQLRFSLFIFETAS